MGDIRAHPPVLRLLAAFSRHPAALDWARARAEADWGPDALESPRFDFTETAYYEPTMGQGLAKTFWAFEPPAEPAELPAWKLAANAWEAEYATLGRHAEPRPVNLDPGYLTAGKLVLASTKDHAHRVYLRDGVFAEVTLYFKDGAWREREWTFPDYRRADYHRFFDTCRMLLREKLRNRS
jgi:hypothetical protein